MSADELLLCFDGKGNPAEPRLRSEAHGRSAVFWHGVTHIWVVNSCLEVLCSRRAEFLDANAGLWQTFFGGHVLASETFEQNAVRELEEEAGIKINIDELLFLQNGKNEASRHFSKYYAVAFNGKTADLKFNDKETAEAKWMSFGQYETTRAANPEMWCNTLSAEKYELIKKNF